MSLRTALRLVLAALLVVTLVGPAAAQVAVAPMPRAKATREIRLGLHVGGPQVIQVEYEYRRLDAPAVAPIPRVVPPIGRGDFDLFIEQVVPGQTADYPAYRVALPAPPCCAFDRCAQPTPQIARQLPGCEVANLTWQYGGPPIAARHAVFAPAGECNVYGVWNPAPCQPAAPVAMPRNVVEIIGDIDVKWCEGYGVGHGFGEWHPVFRAAPVMASPRPLPASAHPLVEFRTVRCDGNECWWAEPVRVPMPRTMTHAQAFTCYGPGQIQFVEVHGHPSGAMVGAAAPCGQIPAAKAECCPAPTVTHPVVLRQLGMQQPAPALQKCAAETWYRDLDGIVISATFSGKEMKVCMSQNADGMRVCYTITADYAVTNEGLVHGVVTGLDVDVTRDPNAREAKPTAMELAEAIAELQSFVDSPFSFRIKQTSSGMMVSNLKMAAEGMDKKGLAIVCGMYKPAVNGQVPAAKPMKTITSGLSRCEGPRCDAGYVAPASHTSPYADPGIAPPAASGVAMPQPAPPGEVVPVKEMSEQFRKVLGLDACPGAMTLPSPRYLPAIETGAQTWTPPKPVNVPANEFGMMADVFGQMVGQSGGRCVAPPVQACPVQPAGMMLPAPSTMPMPVASSVPVSPMVGTWYREFGARMCVVTVAADHLTLGFIEAEEMEDGKTTASGVVITADYHLMRDGTTAVGIITSVDAQTEGDMTADEVRELLEAVAEIRKCSDDKPFAMKLRVYGGTLVIGNVQMPDLSDTGIEDAATMFAGRYKNAGNKPLPKPKGMKAETAPRGMPTSGLPLQPSAVQPSPANGPVFDQPLPVVEQPRAGKRGKATTTPPLLPNAYSSDPTVRMERLLYQAEVLPQIKDDWQRFWFNKQPRHLTPERIHGGIY